MDKYIPVLFILGFALLGMAWMPAITKRIKISYSVLYVLFGVLLYTFSDVLPLTDPFRYEHFTVRLTEMMVIVSLMGTGLKIDERFNLKAWAIPLKLVSVTMLLSIGIVALVAVVFLGFDIAAAVLLAAVLAPTDPVLADDVQVGPPLQDTRSEVRFSLTAEAGLNDGMAFPFTWLAITIALIPLNEATFTQWFLYDFLYRIIAGAAMGYGVGKAIAYLVFQLPVKKSLVGTQDGFVAFSLTLLVYGATELIHGYGFVAVFVCAVALRNAELENEYHVKLHSFTDQMERMLMAVVLILFGGTLVSGILDGVTWHVVVFSVAMVFLIRPVTAWFSVTRHGLHFKEKAAISFYGIKGIGSFYYLSFALHETTFEGEDRLWAVVSMVVLFSIIIHGISAGPVMERLSKQFEKKR